MSQTRPRLWHPYPYAAAARRRHGSAPSTPETVRASTVACDNYTDCATVCESYAATTTSRAAVRCTEKSDAPDTGEDFTRQVNLFEACIDNQDCVADLFDCGSDCNGIIDE